jgi:hypothetical protein
MTMAVSRRRGRDLLRRDEAVQSVPMSVVADLEYERKGSGRPLVLLCAEVPRELVDALAIRFDVYAFAVSADTTELMVRTALERLHVERPLLFGHGRGAELAVLVAAHRIPRGIVLAGSRRAVNAPLLEVSEAELNEPGRLAERIAAFDGPLDTSKGPG